MIHESRRHGREMIRARTIDHNDTGGSNMSCSKPIRRIAAAKGDRFAFVTHNTKDFSATNTNNKLPHPDIAGYFSKIKSLYFTSLGEALRRVAPALVTDMMIEEEWAQEPRRLKEILDAMDLLFHQVWYNRHINLRYMVETGKTKIVEKETFPIKDHRKRPIQRNVWEGALKAAARVEKKYGLETSGRGRILNGE